MAQFKDVFSTTAKVILALVIIAGLVGVGFLILRGLGSTTSSTKALIKHPLADDMAAAEAIRTTMPKSVWDRGIRRAVKNHCVTSGMDKGEVERALGKPTKKEDYGSGGGSTWTWQLAPGKCLKYDGDKCIEQEKQEKIIFFTDKGADYLDGSGCVTIKGDYIYYSNSELFK